MKRFALILAILILGGSASVLSRVNAGSAPKSKTVILRVTSTDPKSPVSFDASYVFGPKNGKLMHIEQTTPFEIKADAEIVNGVFQKTSGTGDIKVTVSTSDEGSETQLLSGSSSNVVIVGTQPQLTQNATDLRARLFVQAFSDE